jgi:hypothetical protein
MRRAAWRSQPLFQPLSVARACRGASKFQPNITSTHAHLAGCALSTFFSELLSILAIAASFFCFTFTSCGTSAIQTESEEAKNPLTVHSQLHTRLHALQNLSLRKLRPSWSKRLAPPSLNRPPACAPSHHEDASLQPQFCFNSISRHRCIALPSFTGVHHVFKSPYNSWVAC